MPFAWLLASTARQQNRCALDTWVLEVEQTSLPDLLGFAQGIRRDYVAVVGALEQEWREARRLRAGQSPENDQRQLYERATLPVLKHHVLLSAA